MNTAITAVNILQRQSVSSQGGGSSPQYLATTQLLEEFNSAPSGLTITDASGISSISDSRLKFVGTAAAVTGFVSNSTFARIKGRGVRYAFARDMNINPFVRGGWNTSMDNTLDIVTLFSSPDTIRNGASNTNIYLIPAPRDIWAIFRTAGHFVLTDKKLLFVQATGTGTNLRPCIAIDAGTAVDFHLDSVAVIDLTALDGTDWEDTLRVNTIASPTSGQSTTSEANGYIEFTWVAVAAQVIDLEFRKQDANNCWIARFNQSTSRVYLYEKVGGVETERGATGGIAQTFTAGSSFRCEIIFDGTQIITYVNATKKHDYIAATNFQSATTVSISGNGTAVSNLIVWRRDIENYVPASSAYATKNLTAVGDSKTAGAIGSLTTPTYAMWELRDRDRGKYFEKPERVAISGQNTAEIKAVIDASLATRTDAPDVVLYNLGANDVLAMPTEAQWKADTLYIWDAYHTKWPNSQIWVMRPWRRNFGTECNTLATWIADVVALRGSFVHTGPDERVFLENGDNGITYTSDGVHPNTAGQFLSAKEWRIAITGS
jgi:lysophospholipase L1-like esterase